MILLARACRYGDLEAVEDFIAIGKVGVVMSKSSSVILVPLFSALAYGLFHDRYHSLLHMHPTMAS